MFKFNFKTSRAINTDPPLPVPDAIVTVTQYLDGTVASKVTTAYGVPLPDIASQYTIDKVLETAGYERKAHIQAYSFKAVREESTTLEPVAVQVEANPLDDIIEPFEAHPSLKTDKKKGKSNESP